jgi:hypothetical protein
MHEPLAAQAAMWKSLALALVVVAGCTDGAKREPMGPGGGGGKVDDPASTSGTMRELHGHHHDGDRTGLHGMVLFGRNHHFLEHIPMFRRPHNEQLVMRVTLNTAQGALIETDFSDQGYSIKPTSQFSLDDLTLRKRVQFTGDVHRGNYEEGSPRILANVRVTVEDVLVARNLPGTEPIAAGDQEYLLIGEPDDAYLTNYIREARGFQQILRVDAIAGVTPSHSRVHRITARSANRLAPAATDALVAMPKAGALETTRVTVNVGAELWCLQAPEFFERCQ